MNAQAARNAVPCPGACASCSGFPAHEQAGFGAALPLAKPVLREVEKGLANAMERFQSGKPKMTIPEGARAQEGRVLCLYGDAVGAGRSRHESMTPAVSVDSLVSAAADLIQRKWNRSRRQGGLRQFRRSVILN